ncbi:MAG: helix-turn-helix domain-containing protein [Pseudonocardiaceae bacterium]
MSAHVAQPTPAERTPSVATLARESTPRHLDVQLYKVSDVMQALSISRTVVFDLLRSGRLRSVKQGRTRLIPASAIRDYIELLEKEAEAA